MGYFPTVLQLASNITKLRHPQATLAWVTRSPLVFLSSGTSSTTWSSTSSSDEQVEFEVNGNPLDKYYEHAVNFHREFSVAPNKRVGWDRCVGQEEPESGYVDQPNWAKSGVAPADVTHRFASRTFSGDQTPSGQKNVSVYKEMLIPLLFW
jgi:predicted dithiol-disulfide oxidoreductase (DUF899 family)